MAKKRLSDLLHEEAEKFPNSETEVVVEAQVEEVLEEEADTEEAAETEEHDETRPKRTAPTKAELQAIVTELTTSLALAHQTVESQQQQIAELQSELDIQRASVADLHSELESQRTSVTDLQKKLDRAQPKKNEFEEAKKAALQLADANSKLIEEIEALKKDKEPVLIEEIEVVKKDKEPVKQKEKEPAKQKETALVKKQQESIKVPGRFERFVLPLSQEKADTGANSWMLD